MKNAEVIEIKAGRTYKMRNGDQVYIAAVNDEVSDPYQYAVGWHDDSATTWAKNGRFSPCHVESRLDLVREVTL